MDRKAFKQRMQSLKSYREQNPDKGYWDFMEQLAEHKSKEWGVSDSNLVFTEMLNDNTYNYRQMYEDNPNMSPQNGHFTDKYKTFYHPTFSNESMYSGQKSQYNPRGYVGGRWDEQNKRFYLGEGQNKKYTQKYLDMVDPGYKAYSGGGITEDQREYQMPTDHPIAVRQNLDRQIELAQYIDRINHTDRNGDYNPFYQSSDDTYGTVELPTVQVTAPLTDQARRNIEARRGASYVDEGRRKAAPYVGAIVAGAALPAMASTGGLGTAMDIANIATNPTDPLNYVGIKTSVPFKTYVKQFAKQHPYETRYLFDVAFRPIETVKAHLNGTYPNSRKAIRKYLTELKEADEINRKKHFKAVMEDAETRQVFKDEWNIPYVGDIDYAKYAAKLRNTNDRISFHGSRYREFIEGNSRGVNDERFIGSTGKVRLRKYVSEKGNATSNLLRSKDDLLETATHERQHYYNSLFPEVSELTTYSPEAGYYTVSGRNKSVPNFISDQFNFLNKNVGLTEYSTHQSSPDEFLADLMAYRIRYADGKPYELMNKKLQEYIATRMRDEFMFSNKKENLVKMKEILMNLSTHGYADGGEIPPANKPVIPEKPQPYKGKLYKDKYGRKYTEEQVNEYYENSTDEIDKFTGKPLVRGLKHAIDLEDAANVTPIGDAISIHDTYQAVKNKDWSGAGLAALGLLPFVPNVSRMPMRGSKTLVKPKGYIPKVDPNYKQNVISRALHEKDAYSTIPANVTEEIVEQRNRAYELMQEPHAREKAKNIDTQYGTDYLKVYDSMLDKYVNVDEYFNMPDPKYKQMERPTIAAQVTPSQGTTMYFNRDIIKAPEDIPNSVVLHEMGHLVDGAAGMNNEFLKKLGDRSKFIPFNQAKTMYPNMTRDMYNNILQGTEIKSYMNQFRNYLDQNGKLNKGNYTGSYKNLKKEIIEAPRESFNNIKAIFNLYRSPKLFIKDFQMVPVVNNQSNKGSVA